MIQVGKTYRYRSIGSINYDVVFTVVRRHGEIPRMAEALILESGGLHVTFPEGSIICIAEHSMMGEESIEI